MKCFTWLVAKKAYLTQEVLQKKGRTLVPRCFLCNEIGENNKQFLYCKFATQLWQLFFNFTKIEWTMPEHNADLLSYSIRSGGTKSQKKWWKMIPSIIWWAVWRERNGSWFEEKSKVHSRCKMELPGLSTFLGQREQYRGSRWLYRFLRSFVNLNSILCFGNNFWR